MAESTVRKNVGTDLTEGSIFKGLIIFAVPIVLTNVIQQLYSLVDVIVIGQYVGSIGTVGVNTGGEVADMLMPVAMGFSTAGQIYIAQLVGAKDTARVKNTIGTVLTFMLTLAVILGGLAIVFSHLILVMLNCPEEAMSQAMTYLIITALGTPFVYGYNAVVGILRGMGESRAPLYFIIVAAVVNIVLDLILVAGFRMEAAGTAIATVASQFGSFAAAFWYMYRKRDQFGFEVKLSYFRIDRDILRMIIRLGIPQVTRSLLVRVGMLWVNASANSYGLVVSATNSVGNKFQKFLEVFSQGIDTAASSMIGQNLGARDTDRAGRTTLCAAVAALVCAVISSALCLLFPHQIFRLFTNDPEVIELGATFLRIFCVHFFASAITSSFQAMVTACGFVELGFVIGTLDGVVCKIGTSLILVNVFHMGYIGLWWGVATSRILPGIIVVGYYLSGRWKTRKLLTE